VDKFTFTAAGINQINAQRNVQTAADSPQTNSSPAAHASPTASRTSPAASSSPYLSNAAHPTTTASPSRSTPIKTETDLDPAAIDSLPRRDSPVVAPHPEANVESPQISYRAFVDLPNYPAVQPSPVSSYAYSPSSTPQDTPFSNTRTLSPTTPASTIYRSFTDGADDRDPLVEQWKHVALNPPVASPSSPAQIRTLEPPVVSQQHASNRGLTSLEQYRQPSTLSESQPQWQSSHLPSSPPPGL
jgi:hypothetical protein